MNESYKKFQEILADMKNKIAKRENKADSEIWNSIFGELKKHNLC